MGKLINVDIIEVTKFSMVGKVIPEKSNQPSNETKVTQQKTPVMETTFQDSIFYKLSMLILVVACFVRVLHIVHVNTTGENSSRVSPTVVTVAANDQDELLLNLK
jgi:hypothetical protein